MNVDDINWYHSMDLGDGVITKGGASHETFKGIAERVFKHGVEGKSVLDIGAWDGFFSFEAERRGASRVLATDHFCWSGPGPAPDSIWRAADWARKSRTWTSPPEPVARESRPV